MFKTTENIENDSVPKFFVSAALDKAASEGLKSNHVMQRYVVTKGFGCSVIRSVFIQNENDVVKKQKTLVFKLSGKIRYDGEDQKDQKLALNERRIKEIVDTHSTFHFLRKAINKMNKLQNMNLSVLDFFKEQKDQSIMLMKDENFQH